MPCENCRCPLCNPDCYEKFIKRANICRANQNPFAERRALREALSSDNITNEQKKEVSDRIDAISASLSVIGQDVIDTLWTPEPVCPKCGTIDHDWWDGLGPKQDGDSWDATCQECDTEYSVTMCVSSTFSTELKSEEQKDGD